MEEAQGDEQVKRQVKKVAVVTGTRAEYGLLYPVLRAIEASPHLDLSLVVSGMHLSHEFGYTLQEIVDDGFNIGAKVDMLAASDTLASMAESVGSGIKGMAQAWGQLKPDILLVLGDRVEPLAATIAAAYMNIPVAHIHGGDRSEGGLDESARHAITKFAHVHFPATKTSAQRIINMGEDTWRVHVVGSPALDVILSERRTSPKSLARKYGLDLSQPLILVLQHPVTTQVGDAAQQMRTTLECVVELGYPAVVIYPNSDAGGRRMIRVIKDFEGTSPLLTVFKSLPRKDYLSLMKVASVLVGNSSSGIIEAPSLGLTVVNIGIRQAGRERAANVIDVGHDKREIGAAVQRCIADRCFLSQVAKCRNPYGDGKASARIADILAKLKVTPRLIQKCIAY